MEGGREGGRAREGDGGKWPYCFQGHLAFPFRATRGLLSTLRLCVLNKQTSLSTQTVSCLITSHIWKGLRGGFMSSINRAGCGTWQAQHKKRRTPHKADMNKIIWLPTGTISTQTLHLFAKKPVGLVSISNTYWHITHKSPLPGLPQTRSAVPLVREQHQ